MDRWEPDESVEHKTIKQIYKEAGIDRPPYRKVLRLDELHVDPRYQRAARAYHVARLVKGFRPQSVQHLTVSLRKDGRFYLIDGNHRRIALIQKGATHWECDVFEGLTAKQEDQIWLDLQRQHLQPRTVDVFKARLFLGDELAVAVRDAVESVGGELLLKDTARRTSRQIKCLTTIESIYVNGGAPALVGTLRFLFDLFSDDEIEATEAQVVEGMFLLLYVLGPEAGLDESRLRGILAKCGLKRVLRDATAMQPSIALRSRSTRFIHALAALYNTGLRRNRLDLPLEQQQLATLMKRRRLEVQKGQRQSGALLQ